MPTTPEQSFERYHGMSYPACFARVEQELGRRLPADFEAEHWRRLEVAAGAELEAVPFVHDALARIATPACVASNGRRSTMEKTLAKTGLYARFDGRIFSADDVARPKPAPDLFLHAAERMGAEATRCAVIEDSPHGVAAGVAAGMTVFGYAAQHRRGACSRAPAPACSATCARCPSSWSHSQIELRSPAARCALLRRLRPRSPTSDRGPMSRGGPSLGLAVSKPQGREDPATSCAGP